ncbi:alpha/beta fold hydrolase [Acaryochloris sp. IP29b_bin.137]|uniref:alpha/beta fold hydrolase n=1 Tax=Acaryochloris sp. IP29b_bin.137 TaxID=2969217 RepID=UPI00261E0E43|nr:alpha/beta fold hydrolase [Acaryochloris sp. IP29b_bin.137]
MSSESMLSAEVGLWMIHGNLQTPKVWHPLQTQLSQIACPEHSLSIVLEDLWASPGVSLQDWATLFCQRVQAQNIKSRFLLGYSLGGRLAFHALLHRSELWQGAIIVSADPGLESECDRKLCLAKDQKWSHKFLHEPWDDLLQEWNALPVFCGRKPTYPVLEADFSRTQIAEVFQKFSKGHQSDLLPHLQKLKFPILYISGEEDTKYCQIGQTLADDCDNLTHLKIANAGHRVPWENPEVFFLTVHQFLEQHQ